MPEKERLLYEVRESEWLLDETVNELLMEEEKAITAAKENDKLKAQLEEGKIYIIDRTLQCSSGAINPQWMLVKLLDFILHFFNRLVSLVVD